MTGPRPAGGGPRPLPTFLAGRPRPYLIAHRGSAGRAPENTLASFRQALDDGADALETDLWFSRDGTLVCHHDADLARMAGRPERVIDLTWDALRGLALGPAGGELHGVPCLDDLLAMTPADRLLVLELKDPRFAEDAWALRLAERLAERVATSSVVAVSNHPKRLAAMRRADPRLATGLIVKLGLIPDRSAELLGPSWPILALNPWYVRLAHRQGQWVAPLDPDPHRRLRRYLRQGVDAILTGDVAATRTRIETLRRG